MMTDEPLRYGTILNSRDDNNFNVGPYGVVDHVEETTDSGQRGDPGRSPAWRRCPTLANQRHRDKIEEGVAL
jgi:hypothetical protein